MTNTPAKKVNLNSTESDYSESAQAVLRAVDRYGPSARERRPLPTLADMFGGPPVRGKPANLGGPKPKKETAVPKKIISKKIGKALSDNELGEVPQGEKWIGLKSLGAVEVKVSQKLNDATHPRTGGAVFSSQYAVKGGHLMIYFVGYEFDELVATSKRGRFVVGNAELNRRHLPDGRKFMCVVVTKSSQPTKGMPRLTVFTTEGEDLLPSGKHKHTFILSTYKDKGFSGKILSGTINVRTLIKK